MVETPTGSSSTPPLAWLKLSLAGWQRRLTYRREKHDRYHTPGSIKPESRRAGLATHWHKKVEEAEYWVARRRREIAEKSGPRIITSAQLGLRFQYVWGDKGDVYRGAGHYTAGRRCSNAAELAREMRSIHAYHLSLGWGGGSYEALFADDGTIGLLNPADRKSAAVASTNSGLTNLCVPATTGDRMTPACKKSMRWYLDNAHTKIPKAYRLSKRARRLAWRGHRNWPGQSTACPGVMLNDYEAIW